MKYGVQTGKDLAEMSLDELRQFSEQIGDDVFAVLTLEGSVNARDHIGGTAPNQVRCRRGAAGNCWRRRRPPSSSQAVDL